MTFDRTNSIGGSDVSAILGFNPWRTKLDVWREKALKQVDEVQSDAMSAGVRFEPVVINHFHKWLVNAGQQGVVIRPDPVVKGWRHASVDALIRWRPNAPTADTVVEVKTTSSRENWGVDGSADIPMHYAVQVQHYLDVLQLDEAYVPVVFWPHDLRGVVGMSPDEIVDKLGVSVYRVPYMPSAAANIRLALEQFWADNVLKKQPPMARDLDDAKRCPWLVPGKHIQATDELIDWMERYEAAEEQLDRAEDLRDHIQLQIRRILGDAEMAMSDRNMAIVTSKLIKRKAYTANVKETEYRTLTLTKNWRNLL